MTRKMLGEYNAQMLKFQTCLNAARNKLYSGHDQAGATDWAWLAPQIGHDQAGATDWAWLGWHHRLGMIRLAPQIGHDQAGVTDWAWPGWHHRLGMIRLAPQIGHDQAGATDWAWSGWRHRLGMIRLAPQIKSLWLLTFHQTGTDVTVAVSVTFIPPTMW